MGGRALPRRRNPGSYSNSKAPERLSESPVIGQLDRNRGFARPILAEVDQGSVHSRRRTGPDHRFHGRNECRCARNEWLQSE